MADKDRKVDEAKQAEDALLVLGADVVEVRHHRDLTAAPGGRMVVPPARGAGGRDRGCSPRPRPDHS
jgi:hypothetical protein